MFGWLKRNADTPQAECSGDRGEDVCSLPDKGYPLLKEAAELYGQLGDCCSAIQKLQGDDPLSREHHDIYNGGWRVSLFKLGRAGVTEEMINNILLNLLLTQKIKLQAQLDQIEMKENDNE